MGGRWGGYNTLPRVSPVWGGVSSLSPYSRKGLVLARLWAEVVPDPTGGGAIMGGSPIGVGTGAKGCIPTIGETEVRGTPGAIGETETMGAAKGAAVGPGCPSAITGLTRSWLRVREAA